MDKRPLRQWEGGLVLDALRRERIARAAVGMATVALEQALGYTLNAQGGRHLGAAQKRLRRGGQVLSDRIDRYERELQHRLDGK